jgi:hypothetical protein
MSVQTFGLILMILTGVVGPFAAWMLHLAGIPLTGLSLIAGVLFWLLLLSAGLDAFLNRGRQWKMLGLVLLAVAVVIGAVGLYLRSGSDRAAPAQYSELTPSFDGLPQRSSAHEKAAAAEAEEIRRSVFNAIGLAVVMFVVGLIVTANGIGLRATEPRGKKRRRKRPWALPHDSGQ